MKLTVLLSFFITIVSAYAQTPALPVPGHDGGNSSGGGGAVTLADDRVVLADPYVIQHGDTQTGILSEPIRLELRRIGYLLTQYGAAFSYSMLGRNTWRQTLDSPENLFLRNHVLHRSVEFRFVDELPPYPSCHQQREVALPEGAHMETVACTIGSFTWIKAPLFRLMSVREQALTIFHERLHSIQPPLAEEIIAEMTGAMALLLDLFNQQQNDGRPALSNDQVEQIRRFMLRIVQSELSRGRCYGLNISEFNPINCDSVSFSYYDDFQVSPNGGGLYQTYNSQIDPTAYIGVGSVVSATSVLQAGSALINSSCYDPLYEGLSYSFGPHMPCEIGEGSLLKNARLSLFGKGWPTYDSDTHEIGTRHTSQIRIEDHARIEDSIISTVTLAPYGSDEAVEIYLGPRARVLHAFLRELNHLVLGRDAAIENTSFMGFMPPEPIGSGGTRAELPSVTPDPMGRFLQTMGMTVGDGASLINLFDFNPSSWSTFTFYTHRPFTAVSAPPFTLSIHAGLLISGENLRSACDNGSDLIFHRMSGDALIRNVGDLCGSAR